MSNKVVELNLTHLADLCNFVELARKNGCFGKILDSEQELKFLNLYNFVRSSIIQKHKQSLEENKKSNLPTIPESKE